MSAEKQWHGLKNLTVLLQGHSYERPIQVPTHRTVLGLGLDGPLSSISGRSSMLFFAKSVLCFSLPLTSQLAGWLAGQSWGFVERNTQFTGPIQFPFQFQSQRLETRDPRPDPTHAHTISSCRVIYKTLDVAISSIAPWVVGLINNKKILHYIKLWDLY